MNRVVDDAADAAHCQQLVQVFGYLVKLVVDAGRERVVDLALLAHQPGAHAQQIIIGRLLPVGILVLHQEFLGLEVVVRVILITDGHRGNVQLLEALDDALVAVAVAQHLDQALLGAVVAVLAAALALRDPDGLVLLRDAEVHVARQLYGGLQRLDAAQVALDDEGFVQSSQLVDPVIDEQVVADGYLARRPAALEQQIAQLCRVKDDVAVVGDEHVGHVGVGVLLHATAGQTGCRLGDETLKERAHHTHLKLVLRVQAQQHILEFAIFVVGQSHAHNALEQGFLDQD